MNQHLIVKKSPIEGSGIFAGKDFKKGERICFMRGKAVNFATYATLHKKGNIRVSADPLQVGLLKYITLHDPFNLINHSCNPNAWMKGEQTLVALKPIRKGEEITYDYSSVEWTPQAYPPYYTDGWPMCCRCGSSSCRRKISCFPYLPKQVRAKYIVKKIVPNHIMKKLSWPIEQKRCFVCEAELKINYPTSGPS